ncbi:MAG: hypothetical protein LBT66_01795 [Methanobrevibacter sp.]|jgi:hypothetical protein|nr:hypothetical protein [Candidatus Methanovirga meridionalis]
MSFLDIFKSDKISKHVNENNELIYVESKEWSIGKLALGVVGVILLAIFIVVGVGALVNNGNNTGSSSNNVYNPINTIIPPKDITVSSNTTVNGTIKVHFFSKDDYTPLENPVVNGTQYNGTYYDFDDFFETGWLSRHVSGGQLDTLIITNGQGSLSIPDDTELIVFESYGHLDESVGWNESNPNYHQNIKVSFGSFHSVDYMYSNQFDIENSDTILKRDGSPIKQKHIVYKGKELLS